jgi:hypothetical protein
MSVDTFEAGTKVQYSGMVMPAEVLSGPHKTTGNRARYLIRKADGNVSLVFATELRRARTRVEKMAESLSITQFGRPFYSLDRMSQSRLRGVAVRALEIADESRGQA